MDVTQDLADYAAKHANDVLERDVPIVVDAGLLAAFDNTPVDEQEYQSNLNPHLLALTLTSTAQLLSTLFLLPRSSTSSGPTASLPLPTTLLPREKPLPKPKQPTKWERFAKEKGISHRVKEKREFDEEKQEWVNRWGRDGKNKEKEGQWLHEVKAGDEADHNPAGTIRSDRKARITKNTKQASANLNRSINAATDPNIAKLRADKVNSRTKRKTELDRTLLITSTATASMGKFDKRLEGEPKVKGVKRKFESNELTGGGGDGKRAAGTRSFGDEKDKQMDVLKRVERGESKKVRKGGEGRDGDVNARKAVRYEGKQQRARQKK